MFHNFVICASPFPPVFGLFLTPNSHFCRRCWLTFAMVCSTGGNDAAPRPPESTPTPNVQEKGENSDLCPFSPVFGPFFALLPFLPPLLAYLSVVCSTGGKGTASRPFESSPTPTAEEKGEKSKILLIANTTRTLRVTTAKVSFLYTSRARELRQ